MGGKKKQYFLKNYLRFYKIFVIYNIDKLNNLLNKNYQQLIFYLISYFFNPCIKAWIFYCEHLRE